MSPRKLRMNTRAGVTRAHREAEEVLWPVLSVIKFRTPEEASERASNSTN